MASGKKSQRDQLALAVASGQTIHAWAKANGVSSRTCYGWAKKPGFREQVESHRRQIIDRAIGRMVRRLTKAVDQVAKLAESATSEAVRLSASRSIVHDLLAVREQVELSERVARIEQYLAEQGKPNEP
jgi:hypothetical protein